jgi:hypothetical protein
MVRNLAGDPIEWVVSVPEGQVQVSAAVAIAGTEPMLWDADISALAQIACRSVSVDCRPSTHRCAGLRFGAITFIRDRGPNWGQSVCLTQWATGVPHRDDKHAVYHSKTWSDLRPAIDELHNDIERAVEELRAAGEIEVREPATRSGAE